MIEAGDDALRSYTEDEEKRLALNLEALLDRIHRGVLNSADLTVHLVEELHAALFHQVRDHAGRMRSPGRGAEYLNFGPNRSERHDKVLELVKLAMERARRDVAELLRDPGAEDYEQGSMVAAVRLQAELIRIHPFEDGNGRTSRALTDLLLIRLDLRPVPVEAVKTEYNECLNRYHRQGEIGPLVDLYLRLYEACVLEAE